MEEEQIKKKLVELFNLGKEVGIKEERARKQEDSLKSKEKAFLEVYNIIIEVLEWARKKTL